MSKPPATTAFLNSPPSRRLPPGAAEQRAERLIDIHARIPTRPGARAGPACARVGVEEFCTDWCLPGPDQGSAIRATLSPPCTN